MTITYQFTVEDDLLLVKASGADDNQEDVQRYNEATLEMCLENGCRRVLTDETDLEYRLNTVDNFESAKTMAEMAQGIHKLAIVVNPQQMKDASFWETVAVNRGVTVRIFNAIEDARLWIDA